MKVSDIQSSSLKDCTSKLQQVAEAQSEFMQIAIQEAREGGSAMAMADLSALPSCVTECSSPLVTIMCWPTTTPPVMVR